MPDKTLKKAAGLFHSKKFKEVITLLEPRVFQYRDNFSFYYYLGTACLYINDLGGAFSYLNRALQLKENHINCLLGLAAIYLKRRETDKCLQIWLDILEKKPGQRIAQRGLNLLRKSSSPGDLLEQKHKVERIYPPVLSKRLVLKKMLFSFLLLIPGGLMLFFGYKYLPHLMKISTARSELTTITVSENSEWLTRDASISASPAAEDQSAVAGKVAYTFTTDEVKKYFNRAKDYFLKYRENMAQVEINRILLSNASLEIKEKMKVLQKYIKRPDFTSLKDSFPYQTVAKEPLLYQNCYVLWKGKIANLSINKDKISFDFLVDYHREEELSGTVPVILYFGANIKNGDNLEVLGKISVSAQQMVIEGISIHKLTSLKEIE